MGRNFFLSFVALVVSFSAFPQVPHDTAFVVTARKNTIQLHEAALGAQAKLYNGSKYLAPTHTLEEHPYFSSEDWITGSVFYDGELFENVPLMYDLFNNSLITEHIPSGHAIQLVPEKLQYFTLVNHYFERIENESVANSLPHTGFYQILYGGETKVLARRQKAIFEKINETTIERSFEDKDRYFIFRNGIYFSVRSKASVLKLLQDKKQDLKKFIKQKHISFSQNRELLLKSLAEYYDTLK
ncbi:MAG TPA: hypothetical protein VIQ51_12885 [Chryseosolibacter sp.]